jgi:hypothetical protein
MIKNPRNFKVAPTLPLIAEPYTSKKDIGRDLSQEVKSEEGVE